MAKEGAVIDTPAAAEETGLSVEQVRKHVQYAKMKGYIERNVEVQLGRRAGGWNSPLVAGG